jgi:hypothetical protein
MPWTRSWTACPAGVTLATWNSSDAWESRSDLVANDPPAVYPIGIRMRDGSHLSVFLDKNPLHLDGDKKGC